MSSTCDVCGAQPSKYKCPNCTVKYCSLPCFKSHKPTHDAANSSSSSATATATEPQTETTSSTAPTATTASAPAPTPNKTAATADPLTTLLSSPALQHLLQTNPSLRATLRSIYASTVEPDPEEWADQQRRAQQRHSMSFRGRGRGGRGGRGGGSRGGGGAELNGQRARGPWKQDLADKRAVGWIVRAQESENLDAGEGMREFVELVMAAVAASESERGDQRMDEGGD